MIVQAEDMAKAVRVAIDMNHNSTPLLADEDVDTESFDEIIYAKLCDAVRMVEMEAPLNLLEQGHLFGDAVTWLDGHTRRPDIFPTMVEVERHLWQPGKAGCRPCEPCGGSSIGVLLLQGQYGDRRPSGVCPAPKN